MTQQTEHNADAGLAFERLCKDAMRYRKLRGLAMISGALEATVAIGQFDFITTEERFDADVDALPDS